MSICAAIGGDELHGHVPGEENPCVLGDFGDECVDLFAAFGFGVNRRVMRFGVAGAEEFERFA